MISLRLKNYKAQDIITLYEILGNAREEFWNEKCTKDCQNCKYRTPCGDIARAMRYLMRAKPAR